MRRRAVGHFFDKLINFNTAEQNKENLEIFDVKVRNTLSKILDKKIDSDGSNSRNLFEAISLDKNRFRDSSKKIRIIIFSELEDRFTDSLELDDGLAGLIDKKYQNYPISLHGGTVSIFGVSPEIAERMNAVKLGFEYYMQRSGGRLDSLSQTLAPQPVSQTTRYFGFNGKFKAADATGGVKLDIYTNDTGEITDGNIVMMASNEQYWIPIALSGSCQTDQCQGNGTIEQTVPLLAESPFFRKGDIFEFTYQDRQGAGSISPVTDETFENLDNDVIYNFTLSQ